MYICQNTLHFRITYGHVLVQICMFNYLVCTSNVYLTNNLLCLHKLVLETNTHIPITCKTLIGVSKDHIFLG